MYPYLVGTARFEATFYKSDISEAFKHLIVGHGTFSYIRVVKHLEAHPVIGVPGDISLYRALILYDIAPYNRLIATLDAMVEELLGEFQLGFVVFGDGEQAAGVLVDAVHKNSHPFISAVRPLRDSEMIAQGIYQRAFEMTVAGVHNHTGLFVDHKHVVIFVHYIERYVLRKNLHSAAPVRHHEADDIARSDYVVGLDGLVSDLDITLLYGALHTVSGGILHMAGHIFVDAQRRLSLVNLETEMLKHSLLLIFDGYVSRDKVFLHHIFGDGECEVVSVSAHFDSGLILSWSTVSLIETRLPIR